MNYKYPLRVGRAFARLITASRGPSVGRQGDFARDQRERRPKASVRNGVAALRVAGPPGRTSVSNS